MDNYGYLVAITHFQQVVDKLFNLYVPGKTYQIVDDFPPFHTRIVPVLRVPEGHVSPFLTLDDEYKFRTLVELHSASTRNSEYVFRKLVEIILYNFQYGPEMSVAFAILHALTVKLDEYVREHKQLPLNQRDFVKHYLNTGDIDLG